MFHPRTGVLVILSNGNKTAQRNEPSQEFNNGLVMSLEPLKDNQLFEVRIDRKINSWTGSVVIGVTTGDPSTLEFPSSAADLRERSWVLSGCSLLRDGQPIVEEYGQNLDTLEEGDRVGVMTTAQGDLHFFVNGVSQGVAVSNIPSKVYAVVDMYGKCAQVTVLEDLNETRLLANEISNLSSTCNSNNTFSANVDVGCNSAVESNAGGGGVGSNVNAKEKLLFHRRCGSLIKLSDDTRAAERRRPYDEFNNGVVMTHRPIRDDELFEIRIDRLVDKWSGSIEVGITTHNPATLLFPATMTNMKSGTIMMSGGGILTNGKGTRREYGEYNLDELTEGDRVGLMRKGNGNLHYYINDIDQGVAATKVPSTVFGVVDLYGMTVKVTIVDRDDRVEQGLANHRNNMMIKANHLACANTSIDESCVGNSEKLLFHPRCGSHASVVNNGRTAHRPVAIDNYDNAVVLTNRPLNPNEMFEVRLDATIVKWAGAMEIGVTVHCPAELDFPSTMTNIRSGTWMMTGNGAMHNGTSIIDGYGQNLNKLRVNDRVGVLRMANGTLHFFVNGIDQGAAATNVPEKIYGVVDLYGQTSQCTIIDHTELADDVLVSNSCNASSSDLRFHHQHGRNARISSSGLTASRPFAYGEFNDAIVISNRPLGDGEMFEVVLDKMVEKWSGSIEAGVTAIKPDDLEFPSTMTDIDYDTWMLSGSAIMHNGATIRNGYKCDLDSLGAGTRVGMMRHEDASLHYYVNGEDMGAASTDIPPNVYAVIDLYGQCAQVTIIPPSACLSDSTTSPPTHTETLRPSLAEGSDMTHCFSPCCGKNVTLCSNNVTATRVRGYNHGLVFSGAPLQPNELFEIQIHQVAYQWSGSLMIGLTALQFSETYPTMSLPPHAGLLVDSSDIWIITGTQVRKNCKILRDNYGSSLDRLDVGDRVGIRRCSDGTMHLYYNGEDMGVAATNLPKKVYSVIDVYGCVEKVSVISKAISSSSPVEPLRERMPSSQSVQSKDSLEHDADPINVDPNRNEFHDNHGRNILLFNKSASAKRTASYNQGVVMSKRPLCRGQLFQVRIEHLSLNWNSSLLIGVTVHTPEKGSFPVTALGLKKPSWIICGDSVFQNGVKIKGRYGPNIDSLQVRHHVGVLVDCCNQLHLYVNGVDQGVAAKEIPSPCYAVVDLYGQCEEVSLICDDEVQNQTCDTNYREKADFEHGWSEKALRPPTVEPILVNNCEYQSACSRFRSSLGLPDAYFLLDHCVCYCETCYKIRGDEAYYRKGEPPKDYAVPFGWCQFSLRIPPKAENLGILDKWHVAFHGTQPSVVRRVLDSGELLLSDGAGLCSSSKHIPQKNKSKDMDGETSQICFSPTIRYAASNSFTPKFEFFDKKAKRSLHASTAFQVLVQPGAYNSGPQRIGAREPIDGHFSNNDIEWFTKEKGSTILHALLIKIDDL